MLRSLRRLFLRREQSQSVLVKDDRKVVPEDEEPTICKMMYDGTDVRDVMCPVCHEEWKYGEFYFQTKCDHQYHIECLNLWFKRQKNCPVCRTSLT